MLPVLLCRLWVVLAVAAGAVGCSSPESIRTSFTVAGPCSACPPARLEAELERLDYIDDVVYLPQNGDLVVSYQPGTLSRAQIRELILDLGYSVDGEYPLTPTLATCCDASRGIEEMLETDDFSFNPDDANYEQHLEAESDSLLNQMDRELDRTLQSGQQNPVVAPSGR